MSQPESLDSAPTTNAFERATAVKPSSDDYSVHTFCSFPEEMGLEVSMQVLDHWLGF